MQVRHHARVLATREPWPRDDSAITGEGYARLALLRLLALQRATRRAVQTHQRESAPLLARTAMETCIVGLWCLHDPNAVRKLRESEIKVVPSLLTFMSSAGILPDSVIREAVRALGEPRKLPDVRSMTEQIDSRTGATLAVHLYDTAYRPASQYFTHASGAALLRHVTAEYRYSTKPANSWARRAPVRLTDACVGLLAGALANQVAEPAELFVRYSEGHAKRVLPPLLVTISKGMARRIRFADLVAALKQVEETRAYLSRRGPDDDPDDREKHLRAMYKALIARLDIGDVPEEAIRPVVDHFVAKVLAEWDDERTGQLPRQRRVHEPGER
ncbi:hypothetical protein ACFYP7_31630 [Micromonospora arida]|uniref:hypothetical protein n=1 Tax=Micromonospora arida TaxID=2203715 RepID=UPI0036CEB613